MRLLLHRWLLLLLLPLLLVCLVQSSSGSSGKGSESPSTEAVPPTLRNPNDQDIIERAQFAVDELKRLSDSGVYETLALKRIHSASEAEGVFHDNTFLQVELSSPYFKSERPSEMFEFMVMRNFEDEQVSFAIDEFPEMDPDAIEEFWIVKVEQRKARRESFFADLEAEAQATQDLQDERKEGARQRGELDEAGQQLVLDPVALLLNLRSQPIQEVWSLLDKFSPPDPRAKTALEVLDWAWARRRVGALGGPGDGEEGRRRSSLDNHDDGNSEGGDEDGEESSEVSMSRLYKRSRDERMSEQARAAARVRLERRMERLVRHDGLGEASTAKLIGIVSDPLVERGRKREAQSELERRVEDMTSGDMSASLGGGDPTRPAVKLHADIGDEVPRIDVDEQGLPA